MCLQIKKNTKVQMAEEDMVVWKHIIGSEKDGIYYTSYQKFPIELGVIYESDLCVEKNKGTIDHSVSIGLHSYKDRKDALFGASSYFNEFLVKCRIPKEASYYEGTFNRAISFASDKLIYDKIEFYK